MFEGAETVDAPFYKLSFFKDFPSLVIGKRARLAQRLSRLCSSRCFCIFLLYFLAPSSSLLDRLEGVSAADHAGSVAVDPIGMFGGLSICSVR